MKKLLLFACLVITENAIQAQSVLTYYNGQPAFEIKYTDVEGSELLYPDWVPGNVVTKDGKVYKSQKLKYNLMEDKFYFQSADGVTMMFTTPVKEFVLGDSTVGGTRVFRNGFPPVANFTPDNYFEVLVDGKNILLKKTVKSLFERKEYNSNIAKKQIRDEVQFYFYDGEKLSAVKKDKITFINNKVGNTAAIEKFFSATKINLKKEEDLVKLVRFINTLN